MILFREKVVDEIIQCMAEEGHRLPKRTSLVLKKIWFTMDISDTTRRIGLFHNKSFWPNADLFIATLFSLKLDMRLTDPVDGNGEIGIRKMLLAHRSLSTMWRVLMREELLTQLDMVQMYIRWKYRPRQEHRHMRLFGVPPREMGMLSCEGWGNSNKRLLRPDELVMREAVRRDMSLHKNYLDMMLWGHIDRRTGLDWWPTAEECLQEDGDDLSGFEDSTENDEDEDESEDGDEDESEDGDEDEDEEVLDYADFDLE